MYAMTYIPSPLLVTSVRSCSHSRGQDHKRVRIPSTYTVYVYIYEYHIYMYVCIYTHTYMIYFKELAHAVGGVGNRVG